jgi:hypothetical protein
MGVRGVFKGDSKEHAANAVTIQATAGPREFLGREHYRFRMEMSQEGQQWMTLMEGDYTRES